MLFAGAKEWATLRAYEDTLGIDRFIDAIDWGWFFFLTKPIFTVLHFLEGLIGNMGWSIVTLTLLLKALLLPLAWKSYVSMARMKELQPEMAALKERAGDDRQKLQQEMMKLYKEKKVNPAAGCLPILLQIPIFFSLYKVIFVTIDLRHAEWFGVFNDLSAPDPTSMFNLFGLLPVGGPGAGQHAVAGVHRDIADPPGRVDVLPDAPEPRADRTHSANGHDMDAVDLHVHAGLVRIGPCAVLDHEQHDHLHPAIFDHDHARVATRSAGQYRREEKEAELGPWGGGWRISSAIPSRRMGGRRLAAVDLTEGRCLPMDRHWAVAHDAAMLMPGWNPCMNFTRGAKTAALAGDQRGMGRGAPDADPSRPCAADLRPRHAAGAAAFLAWVRPLHDAAARRACEAGQGRARHDRYRFRIRVHPEPCVERRAWRAIGADLGWTAGAPTCGWTGWTPWAERDLMGRP